MAAVNPYLNFKGSCEEAFNFYKSAFGTEFTTLMRFGDVQSEHPSPDHVKDKIMHVSLPVGEGTSIMGSDAIDGFGPPMTMGNNFAVSVNTGSEEEATKVFNALADGGQITMPLDKTFWGAFFGMLTDKFGINWMVNFG